MILNAEYPNIQRTGPVAEIEAMNFRIFADYKSKFALFGHIIDPNYLAPEDDGWEDPIIEQEPPQDEQQHPISHIHDQSQHEEESDSESTESDSSDDSGDHIIREEDVDPNLRVADLHVLQRAKSPRTFQQMETIIRAHEVQRNLRDDDTDPDYEEEEQPTPPPLKWVRVESTVGESSSRQQDPPSPPRVQVTAPPPLQSQPRVQRRRAKSTRPRPQVSQPFSSQAADPVLTQLSTLQNTLNTLQGQVNTLTTKVDDQKLKLRLQKKCVKTHANTIKEQNETIKKLKQRVNILEEKIKITLLMTMMKKKMMMITVMVMKVVMRDV